MQSRQDVVVGMVAAASRYYGPAAVHQRKAVDLGSGDFRIVLALAKARQLSDFPGPRDLLYILPPLCQVVANVCS